MAHDDTVFNNATDAIIILDVQNHYEAPLLSPAGERQCSQGAWD